MAMYHFHADQIKRSAGRTAVAAAAYRAGEKLYNEWDGLTHDYTAKGGVIHTEIMLPAHAPPEYADRATLWNAVEQVEKRRDAQLCYSFDIALQNELTMEENIALAQEFVRRYFVMRRAKVSSASLLASETLATAHTERRSLEVFPKE